MFTDHYGLRQTIPWNTINQGNAATYHKASCTLVNPYSTIAEGISSSSFVQVSMRQLAASSLSKGNIVSTLNFHESIGSDVWDSNSQSFPTQASAVSIELTWLL